MLEIAHLSSSAVHDAYLRHAGLVRLEERAAAPLLADATHLSLQFPGEHCTECAAPDCHGTCDLFERGRTGRCRRFADGLVAPRVADGPVPYVLEAIFRPWGQLMFVGNSRCVPAARYRRQAARLPAWGRAWMALQGALRILPARAQWRAADRLRGLGNRLPRALNARAARPGAAPATALVCILGNPQREEVRLEVSVSGFGASQGGRSVQRQVSLRPGWNRVAIPVAEIDTVIDRRALFRFALVPLLEQPALLQIYYAGFVAEAGRRMSEAEELAPKKVKLLVTDLDNTLWDGILLETPDREFRLFPGVREALEALDQRGILLAIASKNNPAEAEAVLRRLGIWDLFLYPQINWEPKSVGLRRIVAAVNLGLDAVAFVDDADFERGEVAAALPAVRTYAAADLAGLPARPEFTVPVTEESRGRRRLYREEAARQLEFRASPLDYGAFLKACDIRLRLGPLAAADQERVHELIQRTNQLNYSGTRYTRPQIEALLREPGVLPVVMRCEDRYGHYGIVGFALLRRTPDAVEVADLMFSCRIQGKQIEHSFFAFLVPAAAARGAVRVTARFTRTARNAPAARVFEDLGFARVAAQGACEVWALDARAFTPPPVPATVVDELDLGTRWGG